MNAQPTPRSIYRLPWSLNDNVLGWLEPTKKCNLYCEGCYSTNESQSHKSLERVRQDMDVFVAKRRVDSISIAGGDPLTHPQIVDIVRIIKDEYKLKPVLNTNGLALTAELVRSLKEAGLTGFTFHIDASQHRPKWKGATNEQLNQLRLFYAQMVADAGGLGCAFNCTIFPDTLSDVPMLMKWSSDHIDIVHSMVFILYRTSRAKDFTFFAQGKAVDAEELVYHDQSKLDRPLVAADVISRIREVDPSFEPAAYLGGTKDPNSFKWLLSGRIGAPGRTHGWVGGRYMEAIQTGHHMLFGRYLAYTHPSMLSAGRSMLPLFSPIDSGVRSIARRWVSDLRRHPRHLKDKLHFQSVLIIQPIDMMPDGEMNMCDGCPDMTVHNGELVWSCRLEEQLTHGCFLTAAPTMPEA